MKENRIRKNNRGDSLILVIGCIALLSIVGIILLAKSLDNQNMKVAEAQAQASFLGAESGSAELVTVIETVAQEVVGDAFGDMLIEYSLSDSDAAIKDRYNEFFSKKVKEKLTADTLENQLKTALGVTNITGMSVNYDTVVIEPNTDLNKADYTDVVRVKKVEISYATAGSLSKITTDICIQARIPDVKAGFNSGISCDFLDFGLIADGDVMVNAQQNVFLTGNMYAGGDLVTTGAGVATNVAKAVKLLVKGEIKVNPGAQLWVKADGATFQDGQGIWTGGITVNGGIVNTNGVNVYVVDDLSVEGTDTSVVMEGAGTKYVGFSGGKSNLPNHQQSSAITINDAKNLTLDLSGMGGLYINGCSYIFEGNDKWGTTSGGVITTAAGILQGESVAYKNMQGMYLFPGTCLPQGHNPIIGANVSIDAASVSMLYTFVGPNGTEYMDLSNYVNPTTPFVTRTARLDGGATEATYVYLNFQNEEKAAQFTRDYMATSKGTSVNNQITSLGTTSKIALPTTTYTLANALSYTNGAVNMLPSVTSMQLPTLKSICMLAKQRYKGLFSSLRAEIGEEKADSYKMVRDGILLTSAINTLPYNTGTGMTMDNPNGEEFSEYTFYVHNGDLTINGSSPYRTMNGILIVNGDLTIAAASTKLKGLVLVTGEVTMTQRADIEADQKAVETLLGDAQVAKYFRVYGEAGGHGYLSSESVKISFENWEKN